MTPLRAWACLPEHPTGDQSLVAPVPDAHDLLARTRGQADEKIPVFLSSHPGTAERVHCN
jgi:hypothetical protein